jgi:hypothetical protein
MRSCSATKKNRNNSNGNNNNSKKQQQKVGSIIRAIVLILPLMRNLIGNKTSSLATDNPLTPRAHTIKLFSVIIIGLLL